MVAIPRLENFGAMAPKASIIAVKVTSNGAPAHDGQSAETGFFDMNFVLKGMDFVVAKAAELSMPVVMLPNIDSNGGPTDGTSQLSRKIDATVGSGIKGVAFLNGPGDEGGADNHAQGTIEPGQTVSLVVETARADEFTGEVPNTTWGYGKVDAYKAVKAALASVDPDPEIHAAIVLTGDDPKLSFSSTAGLTYQIEYKDDINDVEWKELVSGLTATGPETIYLDETLGANGLAVLPHWRCSAMVGMT